MVCVPHLCYPVLMSCFLRHLIVFSLVLTALTACGRAWVVARYPDKGIIGHTGFWNDEDSQKEIEQLAHCRPFTIVADELKSKDKLVSTQEFVSISGSETGSVYGPAGSLNYQGRSNRSGFVPVTQTKTEEWREVTYQCSPDSSKKTE